MKGDSLVSLLQMRKLAFYLTNSLGFVIIYLFCFQRVYNNQFITVLIRFTFLLQMPLSYQMTAPLSDGELVNLLMQSPLYQKLQDIKNKLKGEEPQTKDQKKEGSFFKL